MTFLKDTPLLWRILLLAVVFVIYSGTIGPSIIDHSLVGKYGFEIYGGTGKALIFACISFGLLVHKKWQRLETADWKITNSMWLVLSAISYTAALLAVHKLQLGLHGLLWPVLAHLGIVTSLVFALLGIIGWQNLVAVYKSFRFELLVAFALAIGFYIFLEAIYGLWRVLAVVVMQSASWLLRLSGLNVVVIPPETVLLDKFGIKISQYCSGIESIALFTALYAVIGIMDRTKFNFRRYSAVFLPALVLLFGCNILRVYGLIMAGYYIDPHIAFSLFHTYAGMLFFIVYSGIFWSIAYKRLLKH